MANCELCDNKNEDTLHRVLLRNADVCSTMKHLCKQCLLDCTNAYIPVDPDAFAKILEKLRNEGEFSEIFFPKPLEESI